MATVDIQNLEGKVTGKADLDASLFAAIPLDLAIADGCTHVLVLQTRPAGSFVRRPSIIGRLTIPSPRSGLA